MDTTTKIEEVIIIGGGPAGLSAAIYNARASLEPLVFAGSPPGGQLTLTSEVENYPGFEHILGPELIEKMRAQAIKFGAKVLDENILSVDFSTRPFQVTTLKGVHKAKSVIITTGAKAIWLGLESETRLRGRGVSACATCDGFFFRNKEVAVVGGGDTAMEEAMTLTKFATKVYVIHRRDSFRASKIMQERVLKHPKIEVIWNSAVVEVLGEMKVEGIKLQKLDSNAAPVGEPTVFPLQGLFLGIGHKPDTELFKNSIKLDEKGYVLNTTLVGLEAMKKKSDGSLATSTEGFDPTYPNMTSVPGIFAAGDCVDIYYRQASTAAGMGVGAALDAERWLEVNGE